MHDRYATLAGVASRTDKEDALKLAKEIRGRPAEDLPRACAPTEETQEMRKVVSEYREIVRLRTQKTSRLHGACEHAGFTDLRRRGLAARAGRAGSLARLSGYEREEAERLMQASGLAEAQKSELDGEKDF